MDHTKPLGCGSRRIIYEIHVSWKINSANHESREYFSVRPSVEDVREIGHLDKFSGIIDKYQNKLRCTKNLKKLLECTRWLAFSA